MDLTEFRVVNAGDILDILVALSVHASTHGGMPANELIDILLDIGQHPIVMQIDFVCLNPSKAYKGAETVKVRVCMTAIYYRFIIQTR
ncbi:hypothetical protein ACWF7H_27495 [Peribacillus butanolivorans]|uniref:hypothetical protein n=1 Tax=Peribacillus butanolivorans TaxID=421767 RepID=UPI0036D1C383